MISIITKYNYVYLQLQIKFDTEKKYNDPKWGRHHIGEGVQIISPREDT